MPTFDANIARPSPPPTADDGAKLQLQRGTAAQGGTAEQMSVAAIPQSEAEMVSMDEARAVELLNISAAQGNSDAQTKLARRFLKGEGIDKDEAKAVEWLRLEQGNADAQYNLQPGSVFRHGHGHRQG